MTTSSPPSPVHFWRPENDASKPHVEQLRKKLAKFPTLPLRVMRVSQMDADLLDRELGTMMKDELWAAFKLFKSKLHERFEPELTAVLQFVMHRLSVQSSGASYGCQLQNLKYRNEWNCSHGLQSTAKEAPLTTAQKWMHAALHIGKRWAWLRLARFALTEGWSDHDESDSRRRIWNLHQRIEKAYRTLSLANFLVFLFDGKYRSVIDRILGIRLVYARREVSRQVNFEFLNRQLVWQGFTEFLVFLLPLLNLNRLHRSLVRLFSSRSSSTNLSSLPDHICTLCYERTTNPSADHSTATASSTIHIPTRAIPCGHVYCYYCIASERMKDPDWLCLRCGEKVTGINRVRGDKDEQADEDERKNEGPTELKNQR